MEALLILVIVAALLALGYAAFNFIGVKKLGEGTYRMKEIAAAIRVGANAFITYEYKIIAVVVVIIAIAFAAIFTVQYGEFSWEPSVCFMIGVIMSASAGWVGMKIATYANVRVSNTARNTKNIGSTLKVALKGGSVMGLCVGGFALLGLFLVYIIFGFGLNMLDIEALRGAHVFTQCLSCYALGCSIVAMFNNELNTSAQMIFTVHDINLMDCKRMFRKEQIWFVHKDEEGVYVYSLADFTAQQGVRDTTDVMEKYRKGALGALPDPELINSLLSIKSGVKGDDADAK